MIHTAWVTQSYKILKADARRAEQVDVSRSGKSRPKTHTRISVGCDLLEREFELWT